MASGESALTHATSLEPFEGVLESGRVPDIDQRALVVYMFWDHRPRQGPRVLVGESADTDLSHAYKYSTETTPRHSLRSSFTTNQPQTRDTSAGARIAYRITAAPSRRICASCTRLWHAYCSEAIAGEASS